MKYIHLLLPSSLFLLTSSLILLQSALTAQEVLQWRGPDRTGRYPETGLLKSWPEGGPTLLWECDGLGNGYSSPVITSNRIYVNGEIDSVARLFALDHAGSLLWNAPVGSEWMANYPGSRSTPTVVDTLIYVTTGMGTVACLEAETGKVRWSYDMPRDFHAPRTNFGFSESLVVDGHRVFCTPGNRDTNVVALNRFTGDILWISPGLGEKAAYCSPLLIRLPERHILVTFTAHALLGIDVSDGTLLWSHAQEGEGDVHVNTPWYEQGYIYYITSDGNGSVKLKLSETGTEITEVWRNKDCDNAIGAFIKWGEYIYTSSYGSRQYYIQDINTGRITDSVKFDKGTVIAADSMLYLYNERGQMGLFRPAGPTMEWISSFRITRGTKAHFAHPVICDGVLFVRHGNSLLAYKIRQ